ncbi:hypothetical protein [Maribacter halichondriae]|uniref:hypothetical protein n=1 Tax=Maribacter halichondriae TaxID=2980554 RepID=UPI00235991F2|nr:hypothetical protein [Maribacter sp. Hal144]
MNHKEHYTERYFKYQGTIGEFGGWANLDKFLKYIDENQTIVDFGSGGGFLLNNITCKDKVGVEINATAKKNQKKSVSKVSSPQNYWKIILQIW